MIGWTFAAAASSSPFQLMPASLFADKNPIKILFEVKCSSSWQMSMHRCGQRKKTALSKTTGAVRKRLTLAVLAGLLSPAKKFRDGKSRPVTLLSGYCELPAVPAAGHCERVPRPTQWQQQLRDFMVLAHSQSVASENFYRQQLKMVIEGGRTALPSPSVCSQPVQRFPHSRHPVSSNQADKPIHSTNCRHCDLARLGHSTLLSAE